MCFISVLLQYTKIYKYYTQTLKLDAYAHTVVHSLFEQLHFWQCLAFMLYKIVLLKLQLDWTSWRWNFVKILFKIGN